MKTFLRVPCPVTGVEVNYMLSYYSSGVTSTERWCESCGNTHLFTVTLESRLIGTKSSRTDGLVWEKGQYIQYVKDRQSKEGSS